MVIDVFTYNGEQDILDIRLNILFPFVDQFIIVEAPTTFSGNPKPLYFQRHMHRFEKFVDKIRYFVVNEDYSPEERALAESSQNTQGAAHWKHEFLQKESIKKALTYLNDDDVVFIGDVDEIWNPYEMYAPKENLTGKLKLRVYTYYLNNRSSEEFWGTIAYPYKLIKDSCLNHLRTQSPKTERYYGWHFTSMGGYEALKQKLNDSYDSTTYNTDWVKEHLQENVENRRDFLGRDFMFTIDESDLPTYLRENRGKYKHLFL